MLSRIGLTCPVSRKAKQDIETEISRSVYEKGHFGSGAAPNSVWACRYLRPGMPPTGRSRSYGLRQPRCRFSKAQARLAHSKRGTLTHPQTELGVAPDCIFSSCCPFRTRSNINCTKPPEEHDYHRLAFFARLSHYEQTGSLRHKEAQKAVKQREFLEQHQDTLLPLAVELRRQTRGYTRGFIWRPDEGDWCIHRDPVSGSEAIKMVWLVCEYDETHTIPNHRTLVFRISFPEYGYDEEIDEGEIADCLWIPTVHQCLRWLNSRGYGIELVQVGEVAQVRSVIGVPPIPGFFPTAQHALLETVLAVLSQPHSI